MTPTPIDINPSALESVLEILARHVPDRGVRVFGSRATWTAKEFSDLDLVVMGEEPVSSAVYSALREDFEDSNLPFKVDVVDWATTSESFREVIRRTSVPFVESASEGDARSERPW